MKKLLSRLLFPFVLFLLVFFLFLANFTPGTYLSGWDNLHPEFNPLMNLERAWQSAWQEYQGLGLLAGMAHGADLFRQLVFLPLALLLPASLFRYVWHFLMVLTGVISSFYLFKFFLQKEKQQDLLAFLGASFYLLNFGTVQNFYVTFEPFAAFYAFLPLLLLFLIRILLQRFVQKKDLMLFFIISILASGMAYVQTIFVVYFALVCLLFLSYFLQNKNQFKRVFSLFTLVLAINSFWLFNVLHFTVDGSQLLADSKGKAMSNDILSLKNQAFADFAHLAKLQGFWLGQTDFDQFGNTVYLFDAWKTHFSNPLVTISAFSFFALLLLGIFYISKRKVIGRYFIFSAFLVSSWMMALQAWPFSYLSHLLSRFLPLFDQMFRINFTKWIVPFSLFYSLLLTFGLAFIFSLIRKRWLNFLFAVLFAIVLIFYSLPAFQGHFFYERLRVQIPQVYFDLFTYLKNNVPTNSRIANLPQHTFYGWQWNDWGYRGSGFLWYGIKQPILDRAFDVWSEADERYYWQLQAALDKKDVKIVEQVLAEYDVDYLLLDESIVNRNTAKPFNYSALKSLLASSTRFKLVENFGFISLYIFDDQENQREKDFVSFYGNLPLINNSYKHSWSDQAFNDFHDYFSEINNNANNQVIIYPFSSFFTNHLQKDLEFKLDEDQNAFYLRSLKRTSGGNYALKIPDLLRSETYLPFHLSWTTERKKTQLIFKAILPEIYLADQKYYFDFVKEISLTSEFCQKNELCSINVNNQFISPFTQNGQIDLLLDSRKPNSISLSAANKTEYFDYSLFDFSFYDLKPKIIKLQQNVDLTVKIPKILIQADILKSELNDDQVKNCRPLQAGSVFKEKRNDGNYYLAINSSVCDHFYLDNLKHQAAYLFRLEANSLRSIPFIFAVQAESLGRSPLETYLSEGINYQILSPTENFNQGYTLYLSTDSYGREINDNLLKKAEVFSWPYNFLNNLYLESTNQEPSKANLSTCDFKVDKKALWLYRVDLVEGCQDKYLKLSQAYDLGWLAFRNGKSLQHGKFNNWANVWILDDLVSSSSIYLFFWPQLLQYFGLIILLVLACFFIKKMR